MPAPTMIGPLTAEEWMLFFLPGDDERNPLPSCCANVGDARDAVFSVLRTGGDPALCGRYLAKHWHIIDEHPPVPIADEVVPSPLRKLYETYVSPVQAEAPEIDWEEATAQVWAQPLAQVRAFIESIPEAWDVDTAEGRMRAVARIGGAFVAYVLDPGERAQAARELAKAAGMTYEYVALIVDAARCTKGLPWQPMEGARE